MSDNNQTDGLELSRRKLLAAVTATGGAGLGAGAGSAALLSDEEGFVNNLIEAGEFDLKVDWEVDYYNGIDPDPVTISDSDVDDDGDLELVDEPGPIVDLEDVKPGDVIEHTLSLHLFENPGFITMDGLLTADDDNGITEPEDQVDGVLDNADGAPDGDLDNHFRCVAWYDDGDGLPQEIWTTSYATRDAFIEDLIDGNVSFDVNADEFLFEGTLASLMSTLSGGLLLDPRVNGHVAGGYPDSFCFQPSETQYIGILCWLPRDIPGVDDNIIQSDRLKYELGFDANQCRNNIENNGRPAQRPTGGVQPLNFEVTEGYGTLGGGPVDLQSDVGFPEDMVTGVDTSSDPVQFVLDLPQGLDKSAGDQWSLVFDAADDGTVDFRVVFDEFFYQEWDDDQSEWGPEQPVPADIDTAIINGIYVIGIPRDRLSDPFSFGGRVCYRNLPAVSGLESGEDLCIGLTPDLVPRNELGPGTSGFELVTVQNERFPDKVARLFLNKISVPENSVVNFAGPVDTGFRFEENHPSEDSAKTTELSIPGDPGGYYIFLVNDDPGAKFAHSLRYAWLEAESGEFEIKGAEWEPLMFRDETQGAINFDRRRVVDGREFNFGSQFIPLSKFLNEINISNKLSFRNISKWPDGTEGDVGKTSGISGNNITNYSDRYQNENHVWSNNCYALVIDGGAAKNNADSRSDANDLADDAEAIARWLNWRGFEVYRYSQYWGNNIPAFAKEKNIKGGPQSTREKAVKKQLRTVFEAFARAFTPCCTAIEEEKVSFESLCFFVSIHAHANKNGFSLYDPRGNGESYTITWQELFDFICNIPGQIELPDCVGLTFLIDTCHSGAAVAAADGSCMTKSKSSATKPNQIITAAGVDENSIADDIDKFVPGARDEDSTPPETEDNFKRKKLQERYESWKENVDSTPQAKAYGSESLTDPKCFDFKNGQGSSDTENTK
jgi:hypothetical protein